MSHVGRAIALGGDQGPAEGDLQAELLLGARRGVRQRLEERHGAAQVLAGLLIGIAPQGLPHS